MQLSQNGSGLRTAKRRAPEPWLYGGRPVLPSFKVRRKRNHDGSAQTPAVQPGSPPASSPGGRCDNEEVRQMGGRQRSPASLPWPSPCGSEVLPWPPPAVSAPLWPPPSAAMRSTNSRPRQEAAPKMATCIALQTGRNRPHSARPVLPVPSPRGTGLPRAGRLPPGAPPPSHRAARPIGETDLPAIVTAPVLPRTGASPDCSRAAAGATWLRSPAASSSPTTPALRLSGSVFALREVLQYYGRGGVGSSKIDEPQERWPPAPKADGSMGVSANRNAREPKAAGQFATLTKGVGESSRKCQG